MQELSSMDLYYLLSEFALLETAKIDQIYQNAGEFLFQFHRTGHGKIMLKVSLPSMLYLTQYKTEQPTTPPGFCQFLRRRLKNARLQSIIQIKFERILKFEFSTKEDTFYLFIELFGEGNLILTDNDLKIISPYKTGNWKDRTIRGGVKYTFPGRVDSLNLDYDECQAMIKNSDKESIVKTLAMDFTFGGKYAEKICELANIDKNSKNSEGVFEAIEELKNITPQFEGYLNYNEYLDETLTLNKINSSEEEDESKKDKELRKVQCIIDQQNLTIETLGKKAQLSQEIGETIYSNYQEVDNIIKEINKASQTMEWEEMKSKLKDHPVIKELNTKDKKITIELKGQEK